MNIHKQHHVFFMYGYLYNLSTKYSNVLEKAETRYYSRDLTGK